MKSKTSFHKEAEIQDTHKKFAEETQCFATNFYLVEEKSGKKQLPESITKPDAVISLVGYLVKPSIVGIPEYWSEDSDFVPKQYNDLKDSFAVKVELDEWAFDHHPENRGVWVKSNENWYKLLSPSSDYKSMYTPFEEKCILWLFLREVFSDWCSELEDVVAKDSIRKMIAFRSTLTWNYVVKKMEQVHLSPGNLVKHAGFVIERIDMDNQLFVVDGLEDNEVARSPFWKVLAKHANVASRNIATHVDKKQTSKKTRTSSPQVIVEQPQERQSADDSSNSDSEIAIFIQCSDSEDVENEPITIQEVVLPIEKESSASKTPTPKPKSNSGRKKKIVDDSPKPTQEKISKRKNKETGETPKKKSKVIHDNEEKETPKSSTKKKGNTKSKTTPKKNKEEGGKDGDTPKKIQGANKKGVYEFKEEGYPSQTELLEQEFSPKLLAKLTVKYPPGVAPTCKYTQHP